MMDSDDGRVAVDVAGLRQAISRRSMLKGAGVATIVAARLDPERRFAVNTVRPWTDSTGGAGNKKLAA